MSAGEPVGITLADQLFVERGSVACHVPSAPTLTTEFTARVFWLGRTPLTTGRRYKLKLVTQEVECEIKSIEEVVDASTVQTIPGATSVRTNDAAKVVIHTRRPVAADLFERIPATGRLVLVDGFDVAGAAHRQRDGSHGRRDRCLSQPDAGVRASAFPSWPPGRRHLAHWTARKWQGNAPRILERRCSSGTQVFVLGENLRSVCRPILASRRRSHGIDPARGRSGETVRRGRCGLHHDITRAGATTGSARVKSCRPAAKGAVLRGLPGNALTGRDDAYDRRAARSVDRRVQQPVERAPIASRAILSTIR